jgi:hypothetical protein
MSTTTTAPKWLTWGECIELCVSHGFSRDWFVGISRMNATDAEGKDTGAKLLPRKVFPGCKRARYDRASLMKLLTE